MSRKPKKYDGQQEMCERLRNLEEHFNLYHNWYARIEIVFIVIAISLYIAALCYFIFYKENPDLSGKIVAALGGATSTSGLIFIVGKKKKHCEERLNHYMELCKKECNQIHNNKQKKL